MTLDEKVYFLEKMGFSICHEVSNVEHSGFFFDFSATRMEADAILSVVISQVYEDGQKIGKEDLQIKLRGLLGCDS